MSLLSRLFGGGKNTAKTESAVEYEGFRIVPTPRSEGNVYRIAARVEVEVDGEGKTHDFVRADTLNDYEAACDASVRKAKQVIDEQGKALFQ